MSIPKSDQTTPQKQQPSQNTPTTNILQTLVGDSPSIIPGHTEIWQHTQHNPPQSGIVVSFRYFPQTQVMSGYIYYSCVL
ncbi:MAG: hypothetical protein KME64_00885 [Scytonematopsis contorta HA4267-MV1]|jgi:hypothetical protein|nr:hypothetical protein [Scytonematopsis contorta HA4267-MV1]